MLQPISQTEEAFRDTLITKAEGAAFDRLARMWGFPRLGSISISAWRKGLRATALGPRGTPGAIHEAIDGILSGGVVSVTVDQAIANPSRITASAGGPFTADHVGRLVRVAGRLYYSTSFAATYLELATVGTALWDAAACEARRAALVLGLAGVCHASDLLARIRRGAPRRSAASRWAHTARRIHRRRPGHWAVASIPSRRRP